jgi:TolB-like protein
VRLIVGDKRKIGLMNSGKYFSKTIMFILVILFFLSSTGLAAESKVIAVSYFENNSGDNTLDVLSKGIADMMVTDLMAVPFVSLVERSRLEELVKELNLSKGDFVDPKTAGKLGKGLGASHILVGSFVVAGNVMRIDARLLEVSSGKVAMASKVKGEKSDVFSIQGELATSLAKSLGVKHVNSQKKSKLDLSTLLDFSKGLAAVDTGDLEDALSSFKKAERANPNFILASNRLTDIERRLAIAEAKRDKFFAAAFQKIIAGVEEEISNGKNSKTPQYYGALLLRDSLLLERLLQYVKRNGDEIGGSEYAVGCYMRPKNVLERELKIAECKVQNSKGKVGDRLYSQYLKSSIQTHSIIMNYAFADYDEVSNLNATELKNRLMKTKYEAGKQQAEAAWNSYRSAYESSGMTLEKLIDQFVSPYTMGYERMTEEQLRQQLRASMTSVCLDPQLVYQAQSLKLVPQLMDWRSHSCARPYLSRKNFLESFLGILTTNSIVTGRGDFLRTRSAMNVTSKYRDILFRVLTQEGFQPGSATSDLNKKSMDKIKLAIIKLQCSNDAKGDAIELFQQSIDDNPMFEKYRNVKSLIQVLSEGESYNKSRANELANDLYRFALSMDACTNEPTRVISFAPFRLVVE